jgi:hypothetical protein
LVLSDLVGTKARNAEPGDVIVFWVTNPRKPKHFAVYVGGMRMIVCDQDAHTRERPIPDDLLDCVYEVRRLRE